MRLKTSALNLCITLLLFPLVAVGLQAQSTNDPTGRPIEGQTGQKSTPVPAGPPLRETSIPGQESAAPLTPVAVPASTPDPVPVATPVAAPASTPDRAQDPSPAVMQTSTLPPSQPARERFVPLPDDDPIAHLGDTDADGSTNVPMDSWVYPALERLSSMGFIPLQSVSIRPWTRKECLRQIRSAEGIVATDGGLSARDQEAVRLLGDLEHEFGLPADEAPAVLESVYARYGTIAGPAINDSYHFGQTWWNDFGRPQGRGSSEIVGFSVRATYRRFFFYDRQEAQQTPTIAGVTAAQASLFNSLDALGPGNGVPGQYNATAASGAYLRQRPIELYAGFSALGNNLSFGKQELYWGPTTMGPLAFSSNAEPTYNLRYVATRPHPVPFTDGFITYRFDLVFGKFSGRKYPARPYYNGQKADFTFGKLFEVSFTRWSQLFGVGHGMTLHNLRENLFSTASTSSAAVGRQYAYGDPTDPGDRKSDFDFRLHLPGAANFVTIYADAFADDEPNPLDAPRRVVWNPGIYFARMPYLPHMDLRVEMTSSEELAQDEGGVGANRFFYNNQYHDSNLNKGYLVGSAIGRDSRAFQFQSKYWVSARTTVEGGYRQNYGGYFLPGGSRISDGFVNASYALTPTVSFQLFTQFEKFNIPSYMVGKQHNTSGWFQVVWNPKLKVVPSVGK